ncbi:hypothetical protein [Streptomyces sp. C1-2]|uniref:hypothetical protein n=1 Tax=Streptomyces sp. C1-2 TaxID=2720022 RepID=UPI0014323358|nr:hypothetical protein [Streptomyces sp. C1-2]NJP73195.1 hypothetical protein [Streptomyces sp. C1-2]
MQMLVCDIAIGVACMCLLYVRWEHQAVRRRAARLRERRASAADLFFASFALYRTEADARRTAGQRALDLLSLGVHLDTLDGSDRIEQAARREGLL